MTTCGGMGRMAGNELTEEEVYALARAFPVTTAKTVLTLAGFPAEAVPEVGFGNSLDFWTKIAEQVAAGVMPDGRRRILAAARRRLPSSDKFPDPPADPAPGPAQSAPGSSGPAVSVVGGRGVQIGSHNTLYNMYLPATEATTGGTVAGSPSPRRTTPVRVLVIGASPNDPDLPHVRADRESHAIENAVLDGRIEVKVVLGAEATDVAKVGSFKPDILHLVCHGDTDSLVFNDTRGEADFVKAARIVDLLRFYRDTGGVRLAGVVLAACDGHTLAPFFTEVAATVIAHRGKLADPCGVAFAQQFYGRLNDTSDLAAAAREAAQLTAQYSAGCAPVVGNLVVLPGSG